MRPTSIALALALASLLVACDGGDGPTRPDGGTSDMDGATPGEDGGRVGDTTYYGDLRPILVEKCTMCHTEGGIAPFALETYEQAREIGARLQEVTEQRIMPPFLADNSGECNTWANFNGLDDAQIATFGAWVEDGFLEGDPMTPAPDPVQLPSLPRVDVTLEMPQQHTIDESGNDEYRCFVVDPGLTDPAYAVGYDVHPGNPQRVHHVIVYNPLDDAASQEAVNLDATEGGAGTGYPCFGGPRVNASPLVLWAPGTGATTFPRGTGIEMAPGRQQIIQVHYNNLVPDSPNFDRTSIDLMTESSAIPAYMPMLADFSLNIPPRQEEVVESNTQSLSFLPTNVRVWGVLPHMHTLGRSLDVYVNRTGGDECLVDVPYWDFNWQLAYWLDDPIRVGPTDSATITCRYNSMSRDDTTNWGDGTLDEMCLAFVYVTL